MTGSDRGPRRQKNMLATSARTNTTTAITISALETFAFRSVLLRVAHMIPTIPATATITTKAL